MFPKSAIALVLVAPLFGADGTSALTVHEWGTFTTVAAEDGSAQPWVSLTPPSDLPCFVYHLSAQCVKCSMNRVRMETPVLYFYSRQPLTASVRVNLPSGLVTEWYPQATPISALQPGLTYSTGGGLEWRDVRVTPDEQPQFPNGGDGSHYYAARATDSAPLRVGDQPEKVLFYRGIADFDIPVRAQFLPDGKLELRTPVKESLGFAIVFENQDGKTGYRVIRDLRDKAVIDPPERVGDAKPVQQELASALISAGLYPKEAAAMIDTWRDSWFEEGMRIFYIVPRKMVDTVLPIHIAPAPDAMERVFVGRVELLSPRMRETLETALATGDVKTLARCGRFAQPFSDRIIQGPGRVRVSRAASDFLARAASLQAAAKVAPCLEPAMLPTDQR